MTNGGTGQHDISTRWLESEGGYFAIVADIKLPVRFRSFVFRWHPFSCKRDHVLGGIEGVDGTDPGRNHPRQPARTCAQFNNIGLSMEDAERS
jgi:hypothetical protein